MNIKEKEERDLLVRQIYEQVNKESDSFKAEMLKLPQQKLFEKAFEITWKEEIVLLFEDNLEQFTTEEIKSFSERAKDINLLESIYQEWLGVDTFYTDSLDDVRWNVITDSDER